MQIKTFPLQFTAGYLKQIEEKAGKGNIKKFIMEAIEGKMADIPTEELFKGTLKALEDL